MKSKLTTALGAATVFAGLLASAGPVSAFVSSRTLGPNDTVRITDGNVTPAGAILFAQVETTTYTSRIVTRPQNSGAHHAWLSWLCNDGHSDTNEADFGSAGGEIRGNCKTGTKLQSAQGAVDDK